MGGYRGKANFQKRTQIRAMAVRVFGARILMIKEAPHHLSKSQGMNGFHVLANTFAEWYLLGLGDKLILNRYGDDGITSGISAIPPKLRLWQGRVSSFPKTSWVYHLKHQTYDAHSCTEEKLPIDGTWRHSFDRMQHW